MSEEPLRITPKRVDESWKAQIEQEKSKTQTEAPLQTVPPSNKPVPSGPAAGSAPAPAAPPAAGAPEPAGDQRFEALMSSLAMEAFIHLGDVPHPSTGQPEVNLQQAKYLIDLLGMLEIKTKGNLSAPEAQQLSEYLYQLRMRFVEKTQPPIPPPPGTKEAKR